MRSFTVAFVVGAVSACAGGACSSFSEGAPADDAGTQDALALDAAMSDGQITEASSMPEGGRPDARPKDRNGCGQFSCGAALYCADDDCVLDLDSGSGKWTKTGAVTYGSNDCRTKATVGSPAFISQTRIGAARGFVDLQFEFNPLTPPASQGVIARIGSGTHAVVLVHDGGSVALCEERNGVNEPCSPSVPAPMTGVTSSVRIYGMIDPASPYGAFVLQLGCVEKTTLDLAVPLLDVSVTSLEAAVGCVSAITCDNVVDSVVFIFAPL